MLAETPARDRCTPPQAWSDPLAPVAGRTRSLSGCDAIGFDLPNRCEWGEAAPTGNAAGGPESRLIDTSRVGGKRAKSCRRKGVTN
jgi:hypothetical protein